MIRPASLLAAAFVTLVACGPSAEKLEAVRVLRSIDAVRDSEAPAVARLDLVAKLEAEAPAGKLAIAARDACAKAYRPLFEATIAMEAVQRSRDEGSLGPEVFPALKQADAAIEEAKSLMPGCESAHADLARMAR